MAHTFRIVTVEGQPLGTAELARPDWPAGSVIYRGRGKPSLRVVDGLAGLDDPEQLPSLIVEEAC
jgi:hypothetical protein